MFPSKSFKFFTPTFVSIHFQSIFVYGVKYGSHFILLHVDIWLSQRPLLKCLFFPLLKCLGTLLEKQVIINVRISFWTFSFFPLIRMSILMQLLIIFAMNPSLSFFLLHVFIHMLFFQNNQIIPSKQFLTYSFSLRDYYTPISLNIRHDFQWLHYFPLYTCTTVSWMNFIVIYLGWSQKNIIFK